MAPPAKPKPAAPPADAQAADGASAGGGDFARCWGEDLTGGQRSLLEARATAAGLDANGVWELVGKVDASTVNDALAKLKQAANQALG